MVTFIPHEMNFSIHSFFSFPFHQIWKYYVEYILKWSKKDFQSPKNHISKVQKVPKQVQKVELLFLMNPKSAIYYFELDWGKYFDVIKLRTYLIILFLFRTQEKTTNITPFYLALVFSIHVCYPLTPF